MISAITKGTFPLKIPYSGVMRAISVIRTIKIPNQIGSIPRPLTIGKTIGKLSLPHETW